MNDEDFCIVDCYGKKYHSRDGGKQWYRQDAGATNTFWELTLQARIKAGHDFSRRKEGKKGNKGVMVYGN